jgi:hypothetical protein
MIPQTTQAPMRAIQTTVIECTSTQKTGFAFDRGIDTHRFQQVTATITNHQLPGK